MSQKFSEKDEILFRGFQDGNSIIMIFFYNQNFQRIYSEFNSEMRVYKKRETMANM